MPKTKHQRSSTTSSSARGRSGFSSQSSQSSQRCVVTPPPPAIPDGDGLQNDDISHNDTKHGGTDNNIAFPMNQLLNFIHTEIERAQPGTNTTPMPLQGLSASSSGHVSICRLMLSMGVCRRAHSHTFCVPTHQWDLAQPGLKKTNKIASVFLPILFGCEVSTEEGDIFSLPTCLSGLNILKCTESSDFNYTLSRRSSTVVVQSLNGFIPFDRDHHEENISSVRVEMLREKNQLQEERFNSVVSQLHTKQQRTVT